MIATFPPFDEAVWNRDGSSYLQAGEKNPPGFLFTFCVDAKYKEADVLKLSLAGRSVSHRDTYSWIIDSIMMLTWQLITCRQRPPQSRSRALRAE